MGTGPRRAAVVGVCLAASVPGLISCGVPARQVARPAASVGVVTAVAPDPPASEAAPEPPTPVEPTAFRAAAPVLPPRPRVRPAVAVSRPRLRPADDGLFTIEIPRIGVVARVHEGQSSAVLARGPGHKPGSAMPGERGNVVIPGHRTVGPRPFENIDQLQPGDRIVLVADGGRFVYEVTGSTVVAAEDGGVAEPTPDATVTIYACHPKGSDRQRYVVFGRLTGAPTAPAPQQVSTPTSAPARDPAPSRSPCGLLSCVRPGAEGEDGRRR